MAEILSIARGSISESAAASLAAAGNFTIEWYEEILRDGVVIREVVTLPVFSNVINIVPDPIPNPFSDEYNDEDDDEDSDEYIETSPLSNNMSVPIVEDTATDMQQAQTVILEDSKKSENSLYAKKMKENICKTLTLKNNKDIGYTVIVFGCGGTGSRVIELLAQTIYADAKANPRLQYNLVICDQDVVEPKNLLRQGFFEFELGMNKAEALSNRFNLLYNINIIPIYKFITESNNDELFTDILDMNFKSTNNNIVFDCTDNLNARQQIEIFCNRYQNKLGIFLISCGNEFDFGQVVLDNNFFYDLEFCDKINFSISRELNLISKTIKYIKGFDNQVYTKTTLPGLFNIYKAFKDSDTSCAEVAVAREQSMPINSLVANIAFTVFNQLVNGNEIKNNFTSCNTNNCEFSSWNFSIPDNYIKLMVRCIYGTKLSFDEFDMAKEYLASIGEAVSLKNIEYNNSDINKYFLAGVCEHYMMKKNNVNKDKTLCEILKIIIPTMTWIDYPVMLSIYCVYKILFLGETFLPTRQLYKGKYQDSNYASLSSSLRVGNNNPIYPNINYINKFCAVFTEAEAIETELLFFEYFKSINGKVQINNGIIRT